MSPKTRRALVPLTAASVSVLLAAAPASAAVTTTVLGGVLTVASDTASDAVTISCVNDNVSPQPTSGPTPCDSITSLNVSLNVGDDRADVRGVTMADFTSLTTMSVRGDAGQDTLLGVRGAADGGGGNDRFITPSVGPVTGGAGTDSIELDYLDQPVPRLDASISDTQFTATGTGTVAASGIEQYVLSMPDGTVDADNTNNVNSSAYTGRVVVRLQSGADTFTGGSGDDYVAAGPGNDIVNPGTGRDTVNGGESEDVIYTLDGEVDLVDCGDGTDTVTADRGDTLRNCETVNLPPLPPPASPAAPETSKVVGLKKVTKGTKASFVFVASAAGAGFECRVDNKSWRSCTSPFKLNTRNQKVGKHKVYVRATLNGVTDATPSKFGFRVLKPKRR